MRKRFLSLLLVFCMALSLLPGTALAAVGDLLGNTSEQNESLLEQLESFTGDSYEDAYELLSTLGLLDENGDLITDQSIVLDGVEYTLEEIEALLADPATDLTQVAEVDGVPIALSDLATIIAIERQLQYLQETYFSGATFEGEALENLNSLLAQLQSEGLTLTASSAGDEVVFDQEGSDGNVYGYTTAGYIHASNVYLIPGDTYQVKFKLAVPDAFLELTDSVSIVVCFDTEKDVSASPLAEVVIPVSDVVDDPDREYTLSYTVPSSSDSSMPTASDLYLHAAYQVPIMETDLALQELYQYADRSFGTIWGGVSFYEPEGFVFGDGSGNKTDNWNCYFSYQLNIPQLVGSWTQGEGESAITNGNIWTNASFPVASIYDQAYCNLNYTLSYLQACKDNLNADTYQRYRIKGTIRQINNNGLTLMSSLGLFQNSNFSGLDRFVVDTNSASGFPINLASGSATTTIQFDAYRDTEGYGALKYLPTYFIVPYGTSTDVTSTDDIQTAGLATGYISNSSVTLVDDGIRPNLTVTAPAGTYQSGDLIPINIRADEYIDASEAKITINGTQYNLSNLHATSSGKFISLLYEVQEFDNPGLTVSIASDSGITDFFGNAANEVDTTVSDVILTSPLLKNAVTDLTVNYDADSEQLSFGITVNQADAYQQLYSGYRNDTTGAMQLLISVDGGEAQTHTVTMGGRGNTYCCGRPVTARDVGPGGTAQKDQQLIAGNGSVGGEEGKIYLCRGKMRETGIYDSPNFALAQWFRGNYTKNSIAKTDKISFIQNLPPHFCDKRAEAEMEVTIVTLF